MKKGQAALEFMLSYGWAILTVMVVIGAIAYIIPNTESLTRNKCSFPPQMPCAGARLDFSNLTISARNGAGVTINSVTAKVISPVTADCSISKTNLKAEEQFFIYCNNNGTMNIIDDTKFRVTVTYMKSQGSYNQTLTGEVYAKYAR
ncbi:MAG TPA: hypothetical protein VEC16_04770 [Alphaproteobacteria bacterium]|nr:hypothetical protein [Alphaproteobacteria bacterium]